jgi:hypothetical protein
MTEGENRVVCRINRRLIARRYKPGELLHFRQVAQHAHWLDSDRERGKGGVFQLFQRASAWTSDQQWPSPWQSALRRLSCSNHLALSVLVSRHSEQNAYPHATAALWILITPHLVTRAATLNGLRAKSLEKSIQPQRRLELTRNSIYRNTPPSESEECHFNNNFLFSSNNLRNPQSAMLCVSHNSLRMHRICGRSRPES